MRPNFTVAAGFGVIVSIQELGWISLFLFGLSLSLFSLFVCYLLMVSISYVVDRAFLC